MSVHSIHSRSRIQNHTPSCLTWTFLDAEGSVGVFCPGVVLQLEGDGVVDERLRALGHTRPAVVEVGTGLRMKVEGKEKQFLFT